MTNSISHLAATVFSKPGYILISLIYAITYYILNFTIGLGDDHFSIIFIRVIAIVITYIFTCVFMAGLGELIRQTNRGGFREIKEFVVGVKTHFVRILLAKLLIFCIGLVFAPVIFAGSPFLFMGGIPSSLITMILSIVLSPIIILWYPALICEDIGIFESIKKADRVRKNVKAYLTLLVCVLISILPFIIYFAASNFFGPLGELSLIFTFGAYFAISLFTLHYSFQFYIDHMPEEHTII